MKSGPLSHSMLNDFDTCGHQFYRLRVSRDIKKKENKAGMWGDYVHKAFDAFFHDQNKRALPEELETYRKYLDSYLKMAERIPAVLYSEMKLAVDSSWEPTAWDAPNTFLRGIADVILISHDEMQGWAADHKTGKNIKDSDQQLRIMALLILQHWPKLQQVKTGFFWLQHKKRTGERTFAREDIPELKRSLAAPIVTLVNAYKTNMWPKKQSGLCRGWCPVHDCEFWEPGKPQR